jgi:hypothetical protein
MVSATGSFNHFNMPRNHDESLDRKKFLGKSDSVFLF